MTTKSKAMAAGVAIMVTGAIVGWGASRMVDARSGRATEDPVATAVQEAPAGDLRPSTRFQPAPATKEAVRRTPRHTSRAAGLRIPAGTPVAVELGTSLSSKTATVGDAWYGTVTEPVYRNGREVIPAGSSARGVVVMSRPAERGTRAALQLALRSVTVGGRRYAVRGSSPALIAGSPRARNVGAVAGGAAAGALIGRAVSQSGKGTLIGALIGAGASSAGVAASKGYQATIPAGREVQFTTS